MLVRPRGSREQTPQSTSYLGRRVHDHEEERQSQMAGPRLAPRAALPGQGQRARCRAQARNARWWWKAPRLKLLQVK